MKILIVEDEIRIREGLESDRKNFLDSYLQ